MDRVTYNMRKIGRSTLLSRFAVFMLASAFSPHARAQETASTPVGVSLPSTEIAVKLDGATLNWLSFRSSQGVLHYTPPAGWTVSSGTSQTTLTCGRVRATLAIADLGAHVSNSNASEKAKTARSKTGETLTIKAHTDRDVSADSDPLPIKIGGQNVTTESRTYQVAGIPFARHRIKSDGKSWQVALEVEGPEQEMQKAEPALLQSLCSIELLTPKEQQAHALARDEDAVAQAAAKSFRRPSTSNARRKRGSLD